MFGLVDAAGEGVGHLLGVTRVDEGGEGERLFPEEVDHVLEVIDPLLAGDLVFLERILLLSAAPRRGSRG